MTLLPRIEPIAAAGPVVLIAGGLGKGADFGPLRAAAAGKLRAAVLLGRDAPAYEPTVVESPVAARPAAFRWAHVARGSGVTTRASGSRHWSRH